MDKNSVKRHVRFKEGKQIVHWFIFILFFIENIVMNFKEKALDVIEHE